MSDYKADSDTSELEQILDKYEEWCEEVYTSPDANGVDTSKEFSQTQALIEITTLIAKEVAAARIVQLEMLLTIAWEFEDFSNFEQRMRSELASLKKGEQL